MDIVSDTETEELNARELNNIIVEKIMYALPAPIYRQLLSSQADLTPLTVIPEAMKLIREAPDEKKSMKIMRGLKKRSEDSSSDSDSSSGSEEEADNKKGKKDKRLKNLLKEWSKKKEEKEEQHLVQESKKTEKPREVQEDSMAVLAKQMESLSVNLINWQKQQELKTQENKLQERNKQEQRDFGDQGRGRGGYRGRGGHNYQGNGYQGYQQLSISQMGYLPPQQYLQSQTQQGVQFAPRQQQQQQPQGGMWATMGGPYPQNSQHTSNMPPQMQAPMIQPQSNYQGPQQQSQYRERKRCFNCGSTWHLRYNCDKPPKN